MLHKKPLRVLFPTNHRLNIIATSHKCSNVGFFILSFLCIQVFNFFFCSLLSYYSALFRLGVLHFQVQEIPKDFFVDIVSTNNFLTTTLQVMASEDKYYFLCRET